jgi:hypothetical protein
MFILFCPVTNHDTLCTSWNTQENKAKQKVKWDIDKNKRFSLIISRRRWAQIIDTDDAKRTTTLKV